MKPMPKSDPWKIVKVGDVSTNSIKKEVINFYDEWLIDTSRQEKFTTHEHTFMYELISFNYAWRPGEFQNVDVVNKLSIYSEKELSSIYELLEKYVDGKVIKSEIISMKPNSRIRAHRDRADMLYLGRRFHIPIKTNSETYFIVDEEKFFLKEGHAYELNNAKYHAVRNDSSEYRIHLIVDVMPKIYLNGVSFK